MPETLYLVGEFSRLTHLTTKTLRHYHDVHLLIPAVVDPLTGYRHYTPAQIPQAQLIRRLRDVRMPVQQIREVLAAPDDTTRNAVIGRHLEDLQRDLVRTASAVSSLRAMLTDTPQPLPVSYRLHPAENILAITAPVTHDDITRWCADTFPQLYATAHDQVRGPAGALYPEDWFTGDDQAVTALLPVLPTPRHTRTLAAQPYAIAVHHGPYTDIDRTYAALGEHVHTHDIADHGPIRENYLIGPADTPDPTRLRTEVCWPITHLPA